MTLKKFVLPLLLSALVLSACKKEDKIPPLGIAGLVVFNLAPDQNGVMVSVDGKSFTGLPLKYANYSGAYNGVYDKTSTLVSYDKESNKDLATTTNSFKDSAYYSMFFIGYNGNYRNFIVEDQLASLPAGTGKSFVRYFYAIPDSLNAHVTLQNGDPAFDENTSFGHLSPFKSVVSGDLDVTLSNADHSLDASKTINLKENGIYTIFFQGTTQSLDTAATVRVSYVRNGMTK